MLVLLGPVEDQEMANTTVGMACWELHVTGSTLFHSGVVLYCCRCCSWILFALG